MHRSLLVGIAVAVLPIAIAGCSTDENGPTGAFRACIKAIGGDASQADVAISAETSLAIVGEVTGATSEQIDNCLAASDN